MQSGNGEGMDAFQQGTGTVQVWATRTASVPARPSRSAARHIEIFRLDALQAQFDVARLPFSLKILLENLLRNEDGVTVTRRRHRGARRRGTPTDEPEPRDRLHARARAAAGLHRRPGVVDLAAMRDAMARPRRRPDADQPAAAGRARHRPLGAGRRVRHARLAFQHNAELEFERNRERYAFLRWGQSAFDNFAVVPPDTGIVPPGQPRVPRPRRVRAESTATAQAYPDTLVGTDSHTTMINGLGVLGWGVGGIEAEAAMLGQPVSMLHPAGGRLQARRRAARGRDRDRPRAHRHRRCCARRAWSASSSSSTAPGLAEPAAAPTARRSPTWRPSTARPAAIFPVDAETLALPALHRPARPSRSSWSRPTARSRGCSTTRRLAEADLHRHARARPRRRSSRASPARSARRTASRCSDAKDVVPSADAARQGSTAAAPVPAATGRRPRSRARRARAATRRRRARARSPTAVEVDDRRRGFAARPRLGRDRRDHELHQHLEPVGDGRRRPARQEGRRARPDAQAVGQDEPRARLEGRHRLPRRRRASTPYLEQLGFNLVGYGCTTCIGNSGPLPEEISTAIEEDDLVVASRALGQPQLRGPHPPRGAR